MYVRRAASVLRGRVPGSPRVGVATWASGVITWVMPVYSILHKSRKSIHRRGDESKVKKPRISPRNAFSFSTSAYVYVRWIAR